MKSLVSLALVLTCTALTPPAHAERLPWETSSDEPAPSQGDTPVEPDAPGLEPDPRDTLPETLDEDEGEPQPRDALPPNGMALRPTLPYVDRDLVQPRSYPAGRSAAQVSLASIDDDVFLELAIGTVFTFDDWRIAPRLPLRLRLIDESPETDAVIREEDWDEVSDWARALAFVQHGRWGDSLVLRYGELTGVTLGHGALVNRYFNTIDIDHYQGGVYFYGDLDLVGGEVILDDVFDPEVLVGRAFVRPFVGAKDLALPLRGFKVALSLGADFFAPMAVDVGEGGLFSTPENNPIILSDRFMPMFSLDFEFPVLSTPNLDLVPYLDFASLELDTFGLHFGAFLNARFTAQSSLRLRLEYRFIGEDHVPGYISPFYEIERYAWLGGETKLAALDRLEADESLGDAHHGFHIETDIQITNLFKWTFIYTSNGRDRQNDLLTRLRLPHLGPLRLTLFFARLGFSGIDDLFAADRTLGGISARVTFGTFFVTGRILHEWRLRSGDDGRTGFETTLNWNLGGGVLINL